MRSTDVSVHGTEVEFRDVTLNHPLRIASGDVAAFTVAVVRVTVVRRDGTGASGRGASVLSVPWAWPRSATTIARRDAALRTLTEHLAEAVIDQPATDPIGLWKDLNASLAEMAAVVAAESDLGEPIPHLAAILALGAVDNAVHDAWSRAAGRSAYRMYTQDHLNDDLAGVLGSDFRGRFPGHFLVPARRSLPVQHVVGIADPLDASGTGAGERSLVDWLRMERPRDLKVKVLGEDVEQDADRVVAVYDAARRFWRGGADLTLAIDPNEGYDSLGSVVDLMDAVRRRDPEAHEVIGYVEQPVSREFPVDAPLMKAVTERVPVVIDEGLSDLVTLRGLSDTGWAGAVVKAAKGQTLALLVHSYLHARKLFVTMQDLTAVDVALQHSARLASVLACSVPHFEYNSRQYAPGANRDLGARHPALVTVIDGQVGINEPYVGLY